MKLSCGDMKDTGVDAQSKFKEVWCIYHAYMAGQFP